MATRKLTLTVTEAVGRIPYLEFDNVALELLDDLNIDAADAAEGGGLRSVKRALLGAVRCALRALETVTIVADPEDEDADAAGSKVAS
jgi:hypothetical protein